MTSCSSSSWPSEQSLATQTSPFTFISSANDLRPNGDTVPRCASEWRFSGTIPGLDADREWRRGRDWAAVVGHERADRGCRRQTAFSASVDGAARWDRLLG